MGYFSNGSEGMDYMAEYCDNCVHGGTGCAVWLVHELFNYDLCNTPKDKNPLNYLIPRSKDGAQNEQCKMFLIAGQTGGK